MTNIATHIHALERRLLTVMFVDMVRSSELLRKLDIEDANRVFREVISRQIKICEKHGGTVNQVMGDGLMCLFGAEPPYEDHALRAVAAAEDMLEDIKALRQSLGQRRLAIRAGINTGEVILQPAPDASYRSRYQILGETVHVADRILKLAAPNNAMVSDACRQQAERFFQFKKSGRLEWDSKRGPIQLYVRKSISTPSSRPDPHQIARQAEIAEIVEYVVNPAAQGLNIAIIQGEAGFGKTFIVQHLVEKAVQGGFPHIIGINFYPHPVSGRNRLETEVLKKILPESEEEWRAMIRSSAALRLVGDEDFIMSCLADATGAGAMQETHYHRLDRGSQARVRRLVTNEFLRQYCAKGRTLMIFEDLHWAHDEEFMDIESLLSGCVSGAGAQVLCTSRTPVGFGDEFTARIRAFPLQPLSAEDSLRLLQDACAGRIPASVAKTLCALSGGNPYFLREYALWVESELKKRVPVQQLLRKIQSQAPQQIVNVLYAKLESLDKATIDVARTAAVQGVRVDPDMLASLAGMTGDTIRNIMKRLQASGILLPEIEAQTGTYTFSHELLQRVIYGSIARSARLALHKSALVYLRKSPHPAGTRRLMAYHAEQADDPALQYIHCKWAAQEARLFSRHREALDFLKLARQALMRIEGAPMRERHLVRLKFHEIENLFILGFYARAKKRIEYVLSRRRMLPGVGMLKETLSYRGLHFWINGEIPKAEKAYLEILKAGGPKADVETFVRESARLSHVCIDLGEYSRAIRHANNALEHIKGRDQHAKCGLLTEIGPTIFSCLALSHAEAGDREEALAYAEKAQALLADSRDYFTRIYTSSFVGSGYLSLGDDEAAQKLLEQALACCTVVQSLLLKPYALSSYGLALARQGRLEEGKKHCAEALRVAQGSGLPLRRSLFHIRYAQVLMLEGKHAAAMKHLRRAIKKAVASREKSRLSLAHELMQDCYRHLPETDRRSRSNLKYFHQEAPQLRHRHSEGAGDTVAGRRRQKRRA